MAATVERSEALLLSEYGLEPKGRIHRNPTTAMLYTHALANKEGVLAEGGPLVVDTGVHTGRSPKDKFIVREGGSKDRIWWGDVNRPLDEEKFFGLRDKVVAYLNVQPVLYVVDAFAGADPAQRIGVRVITDRPYHALFAKTLFIEPSDDDLDTFEADALVLHAPALEAEPEEDGTRTGTFVAVHPSRAEVLIGGTQYAGEIKKSIFTLMNDRLPLEGILPMHCSANVGDDEHGWSDSGIFDIEGGCYAKVIRLSAEAEPEIFETTRTFGTILENVAVDERGVVDLDDASKTENTRAAYNLERISHALPEKRAGHPSSVVMLTADAFGVLPPIARLTHDQALFYFLSGFTAKLAGTEIGVTEPQPTFSTCFGAPFLPQPPSVYAQLLGEKLAEHDVTVWLVNTGWTGGPFGEGRRMPIAATRAMLRSALGGALDGVEYRVDELFGLEVPTEVPAVDSALVDPRTTWRDQEAYDRRARELAQMFKTNFEKFEHDAPPGVTAAGPRI